MSCLSSYLDFILCLLTKFIYIYIFYFCKGLSISLASATYFIVFIVTLTFLSYTFLIVDVWKCY